MEAAAGGTANEDCEGEDQDESSSSSPLVAISAAIEKFSVSEDSQVSEEKEENKPVDPLAEFRQQWHQELESSPPPHKPRDEVAKPKVTAEHQTVDQPETDEEKAKKLFLRGVELEQSGKLYEAVQHYKRAVQLQPDVERRLYESMDHRADSPDVESEEEIQLTSEVTPDGDDEDGDDDEGDLITKFQRIIARKGRLCEPAIQVKGGHMSWLPYEVVWHILRWVVSADIDVSSLERAAAVCRGLYLAARDADLWRAICVRTWGLDCGIPKTHGFQSWRQMYIERPRLRLNGCYISKTTYLRHGENSFQDQFYKPWYLIEYYRYLRFFPEGLVLMLTTADEPASCLPHLKHRSSKAPGVLSGHYRLIADKVVIVVRRVKDKKPAPAQHSRFRSRRRESVHEQQDQVFHLELNLRTVKSRRNWQLTWSGYSVSARRDHWTSFELTPGQYPAFAFSPVRNYTAEAFVPLS